MEAGMQERKIYAGVEAGGTKFVCAIGYDPDNILGQTSFPTTDPRSTLQKTIDFIKAGLNEHGHINAIGVASFGPLDPIQGSSTYGYITTTPKPGWSGFDFVGTLKAALNLPIAFDTDVNGAALGEQRWGAAKGLDSFIYLTIGTGIGGGGLANGNLMHGLLHPEMGHIRIPHDLDQDPFSGVCPYHGDCLEGLANGPAIEKRWGSRAENLPADHPAWELEAHYLALGLVNFICTLSPQRIILGGGVMVGQPHLFPRIRMNVQNLLNDYVQAPQIKADIDQFIVLPQLGNRAGVLGAISLAIQAEKESDQRNDPGN